MGLINLPDRPRIFKPIGMPQIDWDDPINRGLVGYWGMFPYEFGGKVVHDLSGNGNTGIFVNTPVWTSGPALEFDGGNNRSVNCGSKVILDNISPLTIIVWIKPHNFGQNSFGRIFDKNNNTSLYLDDVSVVDGFTFFKDGSTDLYARASGCIVLNVWQQIAITWDGGLLASGISLFRNGVELTKDDTQDGISLVSDAAGDALIGIRSDDAREFDGLIDHLMLYNRVLSAGEIAELYRRPF